MASPLPNLRQVKLSEPRSTPTKKIRDDIDVERWKSTTGYKDYCLWICRLNAAIIGHDSLTIDESEMSEPVKKILALLDQLKSWVDEIPPYGDKQRFGNLAFRDWGKRLQKEAPELLKSLLPETMLPAIPDILPHLLSSFGDFTRLDYGSGHELSFALFLTCLTLIRFLQPDPVEEKVIALVVFRRYLTTVWYIQDVYRLEPAGSHGVWGLDDFHFLGFIWGSAQLRNSKTVPPSSILNPPLPPTNLYNLQVSRIYETKIGPFHEHSSQLYSIASGVASWTKVNSGMIKMYEAEVLGKRVVVQHLYLGGLLLWDVE